MFVNQIKKMPGGPNEMHTTQAKGEPVKTPAHPICEMWTSEYVHLVAKLVEYLACHSNQSDIIHKRRHNVTRDGLAVNFSLMVLLFLFLFPFLSTIHRLSFIHLFTRSFVCLLVAIAVVVIFIVTILLLRLFVCSVLLLLIFFFEMQIVRKENNCVCSVLQAIRVRVAL